jgi:hypothetical protein
MTIKGACHVARLAGIRDAYRILLGNPGGMRLLRNLNVDDRMHLNKVGCNAVYRAQLVRERAEGQPSANTIINLRVTYRAGSFSIRTLLQ